MKLTAVDTPLLCIPRLLVPEGWVVDVHTHHVPLSLGRVCRSENDDVGHDVSCRSSYNVVTLQSRDNACDVVYYTELFIRRGEDAKVSAETMQTALRGTVTTAHASERPSRQAWVKEVTQKSDEAAEHASIASLLQPTHRTFVQVVWDAPDDSTHGIRIMNAAVEEYTKHRSVFTRATREEESTLLHTTSEEDVTDAASLAKRYAASVLFRHGDDKAVLFAAALRSMAGGCLVEFHASRAASMSAACANWRTSTSTAAVCQSSAEEEEEEQSARNTTHGVTEAMRQRADVETSCEQTQSTVAPADDDAELRRFARDELGLQVESISLSQQDRDNNNRNNISGSGGDPLPQHSVVLATLPLTEKCGSSRTRATSPSGYGFAHLEARLERRMSRHCWEVVKLWTQPRGSVHAVSAETNTAAPAALLHDSDEASTPPPRRSLYGLRARNAQDGVDALVYLILLCAPRILGTGAVVLLTRTSTRALRRSSMWPHDGHPACTDVGSQEGGSLQPVCDDEAARRVGWELLHRAWTLTLPHTGRWGGLSWCRAPLSGMSTTRQDAVLHKPCGSRVLVRQGRLVLSLGANNDDAMYAAYPTPTQCFGTCGALTVTMGDVGERGGGRGLCASRWGER